MCEYQELTICGQPPIRRAMQAQELKSLVDAGLYKPEPASIAAAMLRRRGVRALLVGGATGPAGRIQVRRSASRQAA